MNIDDRHHFRGPGKCEHCGEWVPFRDPAHVFARGMGGTERLNFRRNLVSLCRCCHRSQHDGNAPDRERMITLVCRREHCTREEIESAVYEARRVV